MALGYRTQSGLSQRTASERLFCNQSLLSKWERGSRRIPRSKHLALDELYGANGCLEDLLLAISTPVTLEPRHRWWHNYPPGGAPVWAWIRSNAPNGSAATVSWGPYGFSIDIPTGRGGIIVNGPTSVNNPATLVQLETPGWVDFGRDNVPEWIEVPVLDGSSLLGVSDQGRNETIGLVADHIRRLLTAHGRTQGELAAFLGLRADLVAEVLGRAGQRAAVERLRPTPRLEAVADPQLGAKIRRIREGRGIKQREVAKLLAKQTLSSDLPEVTDYHVRTLEDSGAVKVDFLLERLDMLYRCDGLLTSASVGRPRTGPGHIKFPSFWVGNVWLDIDAPEGRETRFELHWGDYYRPLSLEGRTAVTLRKSLEGQSPLRVETSADCIWQAGIGTRSDAVDVNQNWKHEADRGLDVVAELIDVLLGLAGRTLQEFRDFLIRPQLGTVELGTG